jgi:hypothetical protein
VGFPPPFLTARTGLPTPHYFVVTRIIVIPNE